MSEKSKKCKPLKFPIQDGMGPVSPFRFKYILSMLVNPLNESGNGPVKKLWDRSKYHSRFKLPKELGIVPLMSEPGNRNSSNNERSPIEGGSLPCIHNDDILVMSPSLLQEK